MLPAFGLIESERVLAQDELFAVVRWVIPGKAKHGWLCAADRTRDVARIRAYSSLREI